MKKRSRILQGLIDGLFPIHSSNLKAGTPDKLRIITAIGSWMLLLLIFSGKIKIETIVNFIKAIYE